ncbi:ubiquitin C-terminal hydrolase 15-like [Typha angustifolia]|uniref:ubiquitin C-terminal hydrolase 15-like n=1 Tax=Typha angustifolia TaxID=59011 RepID=UPI003C2DA6A3
MLQPREADIPALFLVFVVLPLVTYIILGIWSEAGKKKDRIAMLAQLAAEEALRVEAMASTDVVPAAPLLKNGFHECARCLAPATTRCSRCKSVRYCSGRCQILHWRQGHKQQCQHWHDRGVNDLACEPFTEDVQQKSLDNFNSPFLASVMEHSLQNYTHGDLSDDPSIITTDSYQDSGNTVNLSDTRAISKFEQVISKSGDGHPCPFDGNICEVIDDNTLFSEVSSQDALMGHKGSSSYAVKDILHPSHKSTRETRNGSKSSSPPGISSPYNLQSDVIGESETDRRVTSDNICSSDNGFASAVEPIERSQSAENSSSKGSTMYKKPPYTVGQTYSVSQEPEERVLGEYQPRAIERNTYKKNESRMPRMNIPTNDDLQGNSGTSNMGLIKDNTKPAKLLKRSLVGLIKDNKKDKKLQLLFPFEDLVKFFQCEVEGLSPRGLLNCGNSCYANAVLQCLTCTKPLMIYLLRRLHSKTCWSKNWCLMCELEQHASMLREGGGPLSPSRILSNMRNIGCLLGGGSQEDAHEFLRLLVTSMQSTCLEGLGGEKQVDPRLQETTLIQQIFGGRLKSKVKCLKCYHESERYENIMDLTLEIHGWVESLEDALTQFTAAEDLDGENMYRCGRCSAYVRARKELSVHEVPNILTIVLKRFETGKYGKINKCVTFPEMLDMIPFVTGSADSPPLYLLYAVVVHLDTHNASFTGHYVAYIKDMQGTWLRIDDSEVQAVPLSQVMSESAYMLFYSRSFPRPPRVYLEEELLFAPTSAKYNSLKSQKSSKHEHQRQRNTLFASQDQMDVRDVFRPEHRASNEGQPGNYIFKSRDVYPKEERFADSVSVDFSDATSSDWSLFTSSDESSFTTESTRDSCSVVDYGEDASLDPISSLFAPLYGPEGIISCKKLSCRPQTRFFSESLGSDLDSSLPTQPLGNVHRGRHLDQAYTSYSRYWSNPKDGFVQTSGFCDM